MVEQQLGCGFIFLKTYFHPETVGELIQFDDGFFQGGGSNPPPCGKSHILNTARQDMVREFAKLAVKGLSCQCGCQGKCCHFFWCRVVLGICEAIAIPI